MNKFENSSIGVVIITHNSRQHLTRCLSPLLQSPLKPKILVVNSSSADGTVELAKQLGIEVLVIPRREFNHGLTREIARHHLGCDIVCMMTPDAYFVDEHALEKLVQPLLLGNAAVAYARQIPHEGADFFEEFPRDFNYPSKSHLRGIEHLDEYGVYTFFCSNSCAAYTSKVLDEIGGFSEVLLGEDTLAVAKILRKRYRIAYTADSLVKHSHRYSLLEEFRRCFDTGLARKEYSKWLDAPRGDINRGLHYFKTMFERLLTKSPSKIPYGFAHLAMKWFGYWLGTRSSQAPIWVKKKFSSQDFYWVSDVITKNNSQSF